MPYFYLGIFMPNQKFYKSRAWIALREAALQRDHYLCVRCLKKKRFTPATTVHHIVSREDAPEKALELENLESLCAACHNAEHPEKHGGKKKQPPTIAARIYKL